jgi:hypothetical protein
MHISTRWRVAFLSVLVVLASVAVLSRKYIWLYVSRRSDPKSPVADLLHDAEASKNPEILLAEANRLAWLFNWPKAGPLYVRAEELFEKTPKTSRVPTRRGGQPLALAALTLSGSPWPLAIQMNPLEKRFSMIV